VRGNGLSILIASVVMLASLLSFTTFAGDAATAFDAANKLYAQGEFSEAASAYETMIQSGSISTAIYFNLGNAQFKSSQIGRAIAAYRRAEQLAPRDPDVRANLQFARNQIQGPTLQPTRWQRWLGKLTVNEWTILAAVAFWSCLLALTLMQLRPALKSSLKSFALGSGLAAVALGACLILAVRSESRTTVIVTSRDASVRSGPLDESQTAFTVHDGAELAVLDTKNDWLQVRAGQRVGWLKREYAMLFSRRSDSQAVRMQ